MNKRFLLIAIAVVGVACVLVFVPFRAAGQGGGAAPPQSVCPDDNPAKFHACALEAAKRFTPPMTADGHPDFNGYWRHRSAGHEDLEEHPKEVDDSGGPTMVVDPPDGKVPIQPWAEAQRAINEDKYIDQNIQCYESGVPRHLYMGAYEFLQTKDAMALLSEETRAIRTITLDGRPHVGKDIHMWQGDSRGHWEGNTLVVETTNQNGRVWLDQRGRFYTDEAVVTERFTFLDANTVEFQATIDDRLVYTRPWTIIFPLRRNLTVGYQIMEESCYEGESNVQHLMAVGYRRYPGMTGAEARAAKEAFERRGRR
jgi:hypothetical protein